MTIWPEDSPQLIIFDTSLLFEGSQSFVWQLQTHYSFGANLFNKLDLDKFLAIIYSNHPIKYFLDCQP